MTGETGDLKPLLAHVAQGRSLSEAQAETAFGIIMSGDAKPSQIGAFLMALRVRGETVEEIAGAARIMRAKAIGVGDGTRTIFDVRGPLSSPASAPRQLVGVFAPEWVRPMAEVLGRLGLERAWVVHGSGLDELTTAGVTTVASLENGAVETFEVSAGDVGLPPAQVADLKGGTPQHNAGLMRDLLAGAGGPLRDVVLLNSGAALLVAGRARKVEAGIELAATSIDSGAAQRVLDELVARTNLPLNSIRASPRSPTSTVV